jgi:ABC-type transport system involved in multi-copper enzyme maturation permease subunit
MNFLQRFINNPIFLKELEVRSRKPARYRRFNYAGPVLHLALLLLPLIIFILSALPEIGGKRPDSVKMLTELSWFALGMTLVFQLLYFMCCSAIFAAGSFTAEKEQNTYELLLSIPVSVPWLITGKLLGSVAPLLVELAFSVPFYLFYCVAGRLPLNVPLKAFTLFLLMIFCFGAIGIYYSVRSASTSKSIASAKNAILAFLLGPFGLAYAGIFMTLGCQDVALNLLKLEPYYLLITYIFPLGDHSFVGWFDVAVLAVYVLLPLIALYRSSAALARLHRG